MMKFLLTYDKPKKKKFAVQSAVFYNIEDAIWFEKIVLMMVVKTAESDHYEVPSQTT